MIVNNLVTSSWYKFCDHFFFNPSGWNSPKSLINELIFGFVKNTG